MAVKNKRRRSWRLNKPFVCDKIFKNNHTSTSFKNHREVAPRNEQPPPFIIDAPHLEHCLDDRRSFLLTAMTAAVVL